MKRCLIIIRHCGERTHDLCLELAKAQGDVIVINERPAFNAFKSLLSHASKSEADHMVMLDADMLIAPGAINRMVSAFDAEDKTDDLLKMEFGVRDKFRGGVFGCCIHKNKWSKDLLALADAIGPPSKKRPTSSLIAEAKRQMKLRTKYFKGACVALHDFGQFHSHVYAKYFNRAIRDAKSIGKIAGSIEKKIAETGDPDFHVALAGLKAGEGLPGERIALDWQEYPDASGVMLSLGIVEKGPITETERDDLDRRLEAL